ncbi:MAG: sulfurtransferase [Burkholderiales bacterium]|nr:sulfurtransferase [Burkholderiales bacterium]
MHPLITAADLRQRLGDSPAPLLLDCSADLLDPEAGARAHAAGHLPGAWHAHLDHDLSGPKSARGSIDGGRHPLPSREVFAERAGRWGVRPGRLVVTYDAQGGCYAARAWWMLRWIGHAEVAVLDGGIAAWQADGGVLESAPPAPAQAAPPYPLTPATMPTVQASELLAAPGARLVVDARAGERFRGEIEPLDAQAGHIPGARHRFFKDNLGPDGRFLPREGLHQRFASLGVDAMRVVHQCGSGVTACHNLLAMEAAGLCGSALYPGSWSEWSADPTRPVARWT